MYIPFRIDASRMFQLMFFNHEAVLALFTIVSRQPQWLKLLPLACAPDGSY
jgi:hypothetical protein